MPTLSSDAVKRPINLSLNSQTIDRAKALGLNLSQTVDKLLEQAVEKKFWEGWAERNKEGIDEYNEKVRAHGVWGAQYRTFARVDD